MPSRMGRPPKTENGEPMVVQNVRLPMSMIRRIDSYCRRHGEPTRADAIRLLINLSLELEKKKR